MFKKCGSGTHIHSTTKVLLWCLSASPRTPTASLILLPPLLHCQNASLIGWEGGGEAHLTRSQLVLFTHTYVGKKCKKKKINLSMLRSDFPSQKIPDWVPGLASGACGVHSFAAYPHVHPFSHPLSRSSSLSATAVEARLAHE